MVWCMCSYGGGNHLQVTETLAGMNLQNSVPCGMQNEKATQQMGAGLHRIARTASQHQCVPCSCLRF